MFRTKNYKIHKSAPVSSVLKTGLLFGVLCLSLLFVQSVDLIHSHDGDLQSRFDCEICLKIGSLDDLAIGDDLSAAPITRVQIFEAGLYSLSFFTTPSHAARAPPVNV